MNCSVPVPYFTRAETVTVDKSFYDRMTTGRRLVRARVVVAGWGDVEILLSFRCNSIRPIMVYTTAAAVVSNVRLIVDNKTPCPGNTVL